MEGRPASLGPRLLLASLEHGQDGSANVTISSIPGNTGALLVLQFDKALPFYRSILSHDVTGLFTCERRALRSIACSHSNADHRIADATLWLHDFIASKRDGRESTRHESFGNQG